MKLLILISALALSAISCTTIGSYQARKKAEKMCNVPPLREPTMEQLQCMEKEGREIPHFESLAWKIEQKKNHQQEEFNENVDLCQIIETTEKDPKGGIVASPTDHDEKYIKEKARRFCESLDAGYPQIKEVKVVSNLPDTQSGATLNCTRNYCGTSGFARVTYKSHKEVAFECTAIADNSSSKPVQ